MVWYGHNKDMMMVPYCNRRPVMPVKAANSKLALPIGATTISELVHVVQMDGCIVLAVLGMF